MTNTPTASGKDDNDRRRREKEWRFRWPNSADHNFNYARLLQKPLGRFGPRKEKIRVAIVGAGIAGLTAGRELIRSGIARVDIYEATGRIGGRLWSMVEDSGDRTPIELGAMRMPFFLASKDEFAPGPSGVCVGLSSITPTGPGKMPANSVWAYYCDLFNVEHVPFPNPGSSAAHTGIYVLGGFQEKDGKADLNVWRAQDALPPPRFLAAYRKWNLFKSSFDAVAGDIYGTDAWTPFWRGVAAEYWDRSFRDFVRMPIEKDPNRHRVGRFGGLGMTPTEAEQFYVIGAGDGGWGAFFDISALYVIRTLACGFGTKLRLVLGPRDHRQCNRDRPIVSDNAEASYEVPVQWSGVQSVAECMYAEKIEEINASLEESEDCRLFLNRRVSHIKRVSIEGKEPFVLVKFRRVEPLGDNEDGLSGGRFRGAAGAHTQDPYDQEFVMLESGEIAPAPKPEPKGEGPMDPLLGYSDQVVHYDAVILSPTTWALQESVSSSDFERLPESMRRMRKSLNLSHWISSCKVFYSLKDRFWTPPSEPQEEASVIPQVLITDTFVRDVYAYGSPEGSGGVLLASYTWEDDADKLLSETAEDLGRRCLDKVDYILRKTKRTLAKGGIREYLTDPLRPIVIQWRRLPDYRGCSKLYRARSWDDDYSLLGYNRKYANESHIYLAGEGYSVEGGWTEPAMRMALDAVVNIIRNFKFEFSAQDMNEFFEGVYPMWDETWSPDPESLLND